MSLGKLFFVLPTLFCTLLNAEIEEVVLVWQAPLCQEACVKELNRQLSRVRGVAAIDINQGAGRATLKWQPDVPFSFQPLNMATRFVGIRVNDLGLKVRGRIKGSAQSLQLVSEKDGTVFNLLNPILPNTNQYNTRNSVFNRQLTPEVAAQLLETAKKQQIITIEGQLFEPFRSPPNNLVVVRITIPK
jgi:hypothetical protein